MFSSIISSSLILIKGGVGDGQVSFKDSFS